MEDYSNLVLPEISELILQHLDAEERKQAVLVCRAFYYTICRLKQNQTLVLNNEKVMDDKLFGSMMESLRQFEKLDISFFYNNEVTIAERTIAIAEKFKRNIKSLVFSMWVPRHHELSSSLLNTLADVEELTLLDFSYQFFPKKELKKLRKLTVYGYENDAKIFRLIPDDSLESLTVKFRSTLNQRCLQTFVNRQRMLKQLVIANDYIVNTEHLALEDLTMYKVTDKERNRFKGMNILRELVVLLREMDNRMTE